MILGEYVHKTYRLIIDHTKIISPIKINTKSHCFYFVWFSKTAKLRISIASAIKEDELKV